MIPLLRENCGPQISFVSELSTPFQQGSFCLGDSGSFPVFPRTHSPLTQFSSSSKDLCFKEDTPLLWNSSQKKRWVLCPFYEMINFLENICGPEYCLSHGWWRILPEIRTFTWLVGSLPDSLESIMADTCGLWSRAVVCEFSRGFGHNPEMMTSHMCAPMHAHNSDRPPPWSVGLTFLRRNLA